MVEIPLVCPEAEAEAAKEIALGVLVAGDGGEGVEAGVEVAVVGTTTHLEVILETGRARKGEAIRIELEAMTRRCEVWHLLAD